MAKNHKKNGRRKGSPFTMRLSLDDEAWLNTVIDRTDLSRTHIIETALKRYRRYLEEADNNDMLFRAITGSWEEARKDQDGKQK